MSPGDLIHCDLHGELDARYTCSHLVASQTPLAVVATDDPEVFLCPSCKADGERGQLTGAPSLVCEACLREMVGVHAASTSHIDHELAAATRSACDTMAARQEALRPAFETGRYWYDLDDEILEFRDVLDTPLHRAHAITVGSYFEPKRSWLWTWANRSLPGNQRVAAAYLRGFGRRRGWASWSASGDEISLDEAWHRAMLASDVLGAVATYRLPHDGGLHSFFALLDLDPCDEPTTSSTGT